MMILRYCLTIAFLIVATLRADYIGVGFGFIVVIWLAFWYKAVKMTCYGSNHIYGEWKESSNCRDIEYRDCDRCPSQQYKTKTTGEIYTVGKRGLLEKVDCAGIEESE